MEIGEKKQAKVAEFRELLEFEIIKINTKTVIGKVLKYAKIDKEKVQDKNYLIVVPKKNCKRVEVSA
jgi:hypothetical protein